MVTHVPVCLADYEAIKGLAALGLVIVAALYWDSVKEKIVRRREKREAEQRRQQKQAPAE